MSLSVGNGRPVRLCQNVILSNWGQIFEYLSIESQIKNIKHNYNKLGNLTEFIKFMLEMVNETLLV